MWYFAWILGILLACSLGIINGLWLEQAEVNEETMFSVGSVSKTVNAILILKKSRKKFQPEMD